jgi:ubiquinone/menaquinone biosynthesis C-methylase UbiE
MKVAADPDRVPLITDELDELHAIARLDAQRIIELGCGPADLARRLANRFPRCSIAALEIDAIQHRKNLANPQPGIEFIEAGAQAVPFADASFDLAIMLKSLHHVPLSLIDQAIGEVARVVKPGGLFYVSEPVYGGAFNSLIRLFNDEGVVRAAAQRALDQAIAQTGKWQQIAERHFGLSSTFSNFEAFETKQMRPSYADHRLDDTKVAEVRTAFEPFMTAGGATFVRPLHVRVLARLAD